MAVKQQIIDEIRRLASNSDGVAPGIARFEAETGISRSSWWGKYWSKWGDALIEAGYPPRGLTKKKSTASVLQIYASICRKIGKVPSSPEVRLYLNQSDVGISHNALLGHFGSKAALDEALLSYARSAEGAGDILAMFNLEDGKTSSSQPRPHDSKAAQDGWVYLLKSGNYYKIGKSTDVERRIKSITVSLPEKAEMIHSIRTDDPTGIESYWHSRFADKRANGEWFRLSREDVAAFRRRKFQ